MQHQPDMIDTYRRFEKLLTKTRHDPIPYSTPARSHVSSSSAVTSTNAFANHSLNLE
jgi:hypothetical protein